MRLWFKKFALDLLVSIVFRAEQQWLFEIWLRNDNIYTIVTTGESVIMNVSIVTYKSLLNLFLEKDRIGGLLMSSRGQTERSGVIVTSWRKDKEEDYIPGLEQVINSVICRSA